MAIHNIRVFTNFTVSVEDLHDPENPQSVAGYVVLVGDNDSGDMYRIPLDKNAANKLGQHFLGMGQVALPNGQDVAKIADLAKKRGR